MKTLISYLEKNKELELTLVDGEVWDIDSWGVDNDEEDSCLEEEVKTLFSYEDFSPLISIDDLGKTEVTLTLKGDKIMVNQDEVLYNGGEGDVQGESSETLLTLT